jgi:hypothetical protein
MAEAGRVSDGRGRWPRRRPEIRSLIGLARAASRNLCNLAPDPAIEALIGSLALTIVLAESVAKLDGGTA